MFSLKLLLTFACMVPLSSVASEFIFEIERSCTTSGDQISFKCEKAPVKRVSVFKQNGQWFGKNPDSDDVWKLGLLKEDEHVLVLDNPVFFSGKSIIYLMKPTKRFYWTEFAYSDILNEQEGTVRYGRVLSVRN